MISQHDSAGFELTFELTTPRCVLTPITDADAPELHDLWTSPGVRRFLWDDEVIPFAQTQDVVDRSRRLFGERRFGLWAVRAHGAPALVGFGALWFFREPPELELLYGVSESAWGRGYATEIGRAVTTYGFESLAMPVVRASTDIGNAASIRVLEKLGFAFVRRDIVGGLDTVFYERARLAADRLQPISIRLLGSEDAGVLRRVADGVFDGPIDPRWTAVFFADPRHHLIVALDTDEVVGMISAVDYVHPDKAPQLWINEVGVAPSHQRQGIGKRLLAAMLEHGRTLGCTEAWLGTEDENVPARRLYESTGVEAERFVLYTFENL